MYISKYQKCIFDKYIIVQEFWHAGHAVGLSYIQKNMLHGQQ